MEIRMPESSSKPVLVTCGLPYANGKAHIGHLRTYVPADIFARYAERNAGITRNVLIDETGKIVMMTRLYNEEEFASLCRKIDELLEK